MKLLAPLAAIALAGCAYTGPMPGETPPTKTQVLVRIEWGDAAIVRQACMAATRNGKPEACTIARAESCVIYAQQPAGFSDYYRTEKLGHELLHCLGADH